MAHNISLVKFPTALYNPAEDLVEGDILIFTMNPKSKRVVNTVVHSAQQVLNEEGGHSNTEHAGFIARVNGELKLIHLLGSGFHADSLDHIDKRTTHVYRINNESDRQKIGTTLSALTVEKEATLKKRLKWRGIIAMFAFVRRIINSIGIRNSSLHAAEVNPNEQKLDGSSICSKFVADCFIEACRKNSLDTTKNFKDDYMNIFSVTTVKTLQAYLGRNSNYDYCIIPHARNEIYNQLKKHILDEADRLVHDASCHKALLKGLQLRRIVNNHDSENLITDAYKKTQDLLKLAIPTLSIQHGPFTGKTRSYCKVMEFAKSQGLYSAYFNENNKEDDAVHVAEVVKQLNYNSSQTLIYGQFRKRGYSDAEARFETKPTLTSWLTLNPMRVTAASVTGIGFFCTLVYGGIRVALAKKRNEEFQNTSSPRP